MPPRGVEALRLQPTAGAGHFHWSRLVKVRVGNCCSSRSRWSHWLSLIPARDRAATLLLIAEWTDHRRSGNLSKFQQCSVRAPTASVGHWQKNGLTHQSPPAFSEIQLLNGFEGATPVSHTDLYAGMGCHLLFPYRQEGKRTKFLEKVGKKGKFKSWVIPLVIVTAVRLFTIGQSRRNDQCGKFAVPFLLVNHIQDLHKTTRSSSSDL